MLFNRVDTNGDGKICRAEYDTFLKLLPRFRDNPDEAKQLFERLDANKDGTISPGEFKKVGTGRYVSVYLFGHCNYQMMTSVEAFLLNCSSA